MDITMKNVKCVKLNTNIVSNDVRDDLMLYKCLCCNRNYWKMFDDNLRDLLIHQNFLIMISIGLFCCSGNLFTQMNT